MSGESSARRELSSNFGRRKYAPKKIRIANERISFRDLAEFACPRKTKDFLVEKLGCDDATAKRWLGGKSRAPDRAAYAVLADILSRMQ